MSKEINIRKLENTTFELRGVERTLTHLSEAEQFRNSDDVYMLQMIRDNVSKIRWDLEKMIEGVKS